MGFCMGTPADKSWWSSIWGHAAGKGSAEFVHLSHVRQATARASKSQSMKFGLK